MKLTWNYDGKLDDGSALVAAAFKGFTILINALPGISYPASLNASGNYQLDLSDPLLAPIDQTKVGQYVIKMRTVAVVNGNTVESVDSAPYTFNVDPRKPKPPFNLAIS